MSALRIETLLGMALATSITLAPCTSVQAQWGYGYDSHHHHDHYQDYQHDYQHHGPQNHTAYRAPSFGGYSQIDVLADRMQQEANLFCLELHYNYQHNPGYRQTYREAYEILTVAKYIHGLEHSGNREKIRSAIIEMDDLFHHILRDDIATWTPHHHRRIGIGGLNGKLENLEETMHHLMDDVGAQSKFANRGPDGQQTPPPPTYGREQPQTGYRGPLPQYGPQGGPQYGPQGGPPQSTFQPGAAPGYAAPGVRAQGVNPSSNNAPPKPQAPVNGVAPVAPVDPAAPAPAAAPADPAAPAPAAAPADPAPTAEPAPSTEPAAPADAGTDNSQQNPQ